MPVIRMNYLDLSPEQRRQGAKAVKERLRASMSNPDLTQDQMKQLHTQLQKIEAWEKGTLQVCPVPKDLPVQQDIDPQPLIEKIKSLHRTEG